MANLSVYNYENPALFLRDVWEEKSRLNKNFSLRSWAEKLGISSHGTFYHIIQGKRPLPKKYVRPLSLSIGLDAKESMYLEVLIDYVRAKTMVHKSYYKERLGELAPGKKLNFYEIETFHYLKNPLHGAIIELTTLKDFKFDPCWIQERLTLKVTKNEIQKSIKLLLDLNLLKQDGEGKLKRSNKLIHTKQDVKNEALQEYHKNVLKMASDEISEQDVSKREYNATAMGVDMRRMPEMKKRIRDFLNDFMLEFETSDGQADEIYQLGIQLFGLTDIGQEKIQ